MRADLPAAQGQGSPGPGSVVAIRTSTPLSIKDSTSTADTTTESKDVEKQRAKNTSMTQNIWVFIFRGLPYDTYNRRHTIFYLDSPDVEDFNITAHAQRPTEEEPYEYIEVIGEERYPLSVDYIHGRLVGRVKVDVSQLRKVLDVIALTPVGGEPDWSCQHFVYHALERLKEAGFISEEQLDGTKDWMMDSILDGAIA